MPVTPPIEPCPNLLSLGDACLSWAESLLDSPLRERRCRLDGVVPAELRVRRGGAEVWDDVLARRHEGVMVLGKTCKGLDDAMLAWQTERLLALEERRDSDTVHVRPELVVEIAFDGVQLSTRYVSGFALPFARVKRYREDSPAAGADTLETVRALAPA